MNTTTTRTGPPVKALTVIGTYSNGAQRVAHGQDWRGTFYLIYDAFPDCSRCHGTGRTEWVSESHTDACPDCKSRFGSKAMIKEQIKAVIDQVKADLKNAKWEGINVKDPAFIADYNVLNPLAHEYRRLLYQLWAYSEPEYTPL